MSYLWLSHVINEDTPLYAGTGGVDFYKDKSFVKGDTCNSTSIKFSSHTGTHVDAPRHFFRNGRGIERYPAEFWIFNKVKVVSLAPVSAGKKITEDDIKIGSIDKDTDCLLIKTGFTRNRNRPIYWQNSPYISYGCASALKKLRALRLIGVDFISVSNIRNRQEGRKVHRILLSETKAEHCVLIAEDMNLSIVRNTIKMLYVFPLRFRKGDGGPCSVIAEV